MDNKALLKCVRVGFCALVLLSASALSAVDIGDCQDGSAAINKFRGYGNPYNFCFDNEMNDCLTDAKHVCLRWDSTTTLYKKWTYSTTYGVCSTSWEVAECKIYDPLGMICTKGNRFNDLLDCNSNTNPTPCFYWRTHVCVF